jgi:hypothetical protein
MGKKNFAPPGFNSQTEPFSPQRVAIPTELSRSMKAEDIRELISETEPFLESYYLISEELRYCEAT